VPNGWAPWYCVWGAEGGARSCENTTTNAVQLTQTAAVAQLQHDQQPMSVGCTACQQMRLKLLASQRTAHLTHVPPSTSLCCASRFAVSDSPCCRHHVCRPKPSRILHRSNQPSTLQRRAVNSCYISGRRMRTQQRPRAMEQHGASRMQLLPSLRPGC
jgi:hypothetical protein